MWERVGGDEWKDGKAMKTERRSSPHEIHEGQGVRPVKGPWLANIQIWAPLAARLSSTLAPVIRFNLLEIWICNHFLRKERTFDGGKSLSYSILASL